MSRAELKELIGGYVGGSIPDYQLSALLMAIYFRGMTPEETATLTEAMKTSGRTYTIDTDRPLIDKHSTGGVGDKVSLVLAPVAAACGLAVPMVSGRGLGHTGGTLDKLEAIPGFRVLLTPEEFTRQVQTLGVGMIGQSDDFVPADKKLYALRDVTGTVECIPLLCSSILSKKAASGAQGVVIDVKTGSGAFMATLEGSRALAKGLLHTGAALGLPVRCVITDMSKPLGRAIGNANEVRECIETLQGQGPDDLREITLELTAEMLVLGGLFAELDGARAEAAAKLDDGTALEIFRKLVEQQDGNPAMVDDTALLARSKFTEEFVAPESGYYDVVNCRGLGIAALALGAGRKVASDSVNHAVGLMCHARPGDKVEAGEPLFTIENDGVGVAECRKLIADSIAIRQDLPQVFPLIRDRI